MGPESWEAKSVRSLLGELIYPTPVPTLTSMPVSQKPLLFPKAWASSVRPCTLQSLCQAQAGMGIPEKVSGSHDG